MLSSSALTVIPAEANLAIVPAAATAQLPREYIPTYVKIKSHGKEFEVSKGLLCFKSEFFKCVFHGTFAKDHDDEFTIDASDECVEAMLFFVLHARYNEPEPELETLYEKAQFHISMHGLAEYVQMDDLKIFARTRFSLLVSGLNFDSLLSTTWLLYTAQAAGRLENPSSFDRSMLNEVLKFPFSTLDPDEQLDILELIHDETPPHVRDFRNVVQAVFTQMAIHHFHPHHEPDASWAPSRLHQFLTDAFTADVLVYLSPVKLTKTNGADTIQPLMACSAKAIVEAHFGVAGSEANMASPVIDVIKCPTATGSYAGLDYVQLFTSTSALVARIREGQDADSILRRLLERLHVLVETSGNDTSPGGVELLLRQRGDLLTLTQ